jgi:dUTP pyrophosphatase
MVKRELTIWIDKSIVGENSKILELMYNRAAERHNYLVRSNKYPDAGFDIFTPINGIEYSGYIVNNKNSQMKLKTGIRCSMETLNISGHDPDINPLSFYLYPRSSISKTPYRLANNVGIIDSGYRGEIIAVFDIIQNLNGSDVVEPEPYSRLVQICCGDLQPFTVRVLTIESGDIDDLVSTTKRGDGGFGSTGK